MQIILNVEESSFQKEKAELTKILDDLENGKATLLSHHTVWTEIARKKVLNS